MTDKPKQKPAVPWLLADGWVEYQDQFRNPARCFYRRFDTPTRCHFNLGKPGIQVFIVVSERGDQETYEMELHGELKDGTWLILHNHGLPGDIGAVAALAPRLLRLWEAANRE